tara:strand:- start:288 stop:782 length:495 start_codon:yes stop_codon:yes gene_type:complete
MKKISYLLFIGIIAFGSCTKQDPIEVNITDSSNSSSSSIIDANLTGHWKQTNVSHPTSNSYWINGQIDLHFFADGTWVISGQTDYLNYNTSELGQYKIHSNNYIGIGNEVFKYSINNGVLTFSSVPGRDYLWVLHYNNNNDDIMSSTMLGNSTSWAEINNLVKQ